MRGLTVAGLVSVAVGGGALVASEIFADEARFWVVGSAANGCQVVERNPLVDGTTITFSSGPYRSMEDAKLAITTIGACKT